MKLLLDTNIIIPLEPCSFDGAGINTDAAITLHRLSSKSGSILCYHPAIHFDLQRDRNRERSELRRRLLGRYEKLVEVPTCEHLDSAVIGTPKSGSNNDVDNQLIAVLDADFVNFLVTEDKKIHSKCKRLGLGDRVLRLSDAIQLLEDLFDNVPVLPPYVSQISAYKIDAADPIFASLRNAYQPEFDKWLVKCKRENRDTFVIKDRHLGCLAGITILKSEDQLPNGQHGKTLKICTFKISESSSGNRYGELLLKAVFEYARINDYRFSYFTAYNSAQDLIDFCCDFGFKVGEYRNARGEQVVWKDFGYSDHDKEVMAAFDFHVQFGPFVTSFNGNNTYVIPIQPRFHKLLFPELELQSDMFGNPQPCGNSIKKAYLCHSKIGRIRHGDNIVFYRSQKYSAITTIGIIENWMRTKNPDELAQFVGTRTVYKYDEIVRMCSKHVLAIRFRLICSFDDIRYNDLKEGGVLSGPPQSITSIDPPGIEWIRNRTGL